MGIIEEAILNEILKKIAKGYLFIYFFITVKLSIVWYRHGMSKWAII